MAEMTDERIRELAGEVVAALKDSYGIDDRITVAADVIRRAVQAEIDLERTKGRQIVREQLRRLAASAGEPCSRHDAPGCPSCLLYGLHFIAESILVRDGDPIADAVKAEREACARDIRRCYLNYRAGTPNPSNGAQAYAAGLGLACDEVIRRGMPEGLSLDGRQKFLADAKSALDGSLDAPPKKTKAD